MDREKQWKRELGNFDEVWARVQGERRPEATPPESARDAGPRRAGSCARRCGVKLMPRRRGKRYE